MEPPDTGTAVMASAAGPSEAYEFSAPKFFDFITEETEEAVRAAESWFEASRSHPPSLFNPKIKESRAEANAAVLCDFAEASEPTAKAVYAFAIALGESIDRLAANEAAGFDVNAPEKEDPSLGSVREADSSGVTCANAGNQQEEERLGVSAVCCSDEGASMGDARQLEFLHVG